MKTKKPTAKPVAKTKKPAKPTKKPAAKKKCPAGFVLSKTGKCTKTPAPKTPAPKTPAPKTPAPKTPKTPAPSKEVVVVAKTYVNPVVPGNFADPGVMRVGDVYYACCTDNKRIYTSRDLVNWTDAGPALTAEPGGFFWAPDFVQKGSAFFLTYTIASSFTGPKALFVAHSARPEGPYTPIGTLSGNRSLIDSSFFEDGGTVYVYFNDPPSTVRGGVMSADMRSITSEFPVLGWESREGWQITPVQEGPFVFKRGSKYYLLFSGHHTVTSGGYAVLCATAPSPRGPWTRQPNNPVMCGICKNKGLVETGHCSAVQTPSGKWYMLYHAVTGDRPGVRALCVDEIVFQGDLLTVPGGAIREPRPYPS